MKVSIIHDANRVDRAGNVAAIYAEYKHVVIEPALYVPWEKDINSRAVRGCALAHLNAVKHNLKNKEVKRLLVLEDDVVRVPGVELPNAPFPKDAAAILVGAETEEHGPIINDTWVTVYPRFWGSHGVIYNMDVIRESNWLLHAYEALASNPIGTPTVPGIAGLCYESVMFLACDASETLMYRPIDMLYETEESISSRDGEVMEARTKNTSIRHLIEKNENE